jgi:hypothetical protein
MPAVSLAECLLCCVRTEGAEGFPPQPLGFYPQRGECYLSKLTTVNSQLSDMSGNKAHCRLPRFPQGQVAMSGFSVGKKGDVLVERQGREFLCESQLLSESM